MKKIYLYLFFIASLLASSSSLQAQSAYDTIPLLSTDSQQVFLTEFQKSEVVVLIFTSNHCIYSKKYEDRLVEMANAYRDRGVSFLLINSNSPILSYDDRLELMKARAVEKSFPCPYLKDPGAKLARHLGATKTPEAFVGSWKSGKFTIEYSGKIDDNPLMVTRVGNHFLRNAIEYLLGEEDSEMPESVPAVGCGIKME